MGSFSRSFRRRQKSALAAPAPIPAEQVADGPPTGLHGWHIIDSVRDGAGGWYALERHPLTGQPRGMHYARTQAGKLGGRPIPLRALEAILEIQAALEER